jgi:hypothetical protein
MTPKQSRAAEILSGRTIPRDNPPSPACSRCTYRARATRGVNGAFCQIAEVEKAPGESCDQFDERQEVAG